MWGIRHAGNKVFISVGKYKLNGAGGFFTSVEMNRISAFCTCSDVSAKHHAKTRKTRKEEKGKIESVPNYASFSTFVCVWLLLFY